VAAVALVGAAGVSLALLADEPPIRLAGVLLLLLGAVMTLALRSIRGAQPAQRRRRP